MAYVYQVSFDIQPDQMSQLEIGASLERTAGYLRTLLPNETGFISTHSMYSLDVPDKTQLLVQTWWETWEDLTAHGKSSLAEDKVLSEFEPHLSLHHLTVHVYEEVA